MSEKQCGNCKYFCNYYLINKSYLRKSVRGMCSYCDVLYKKKYNKIETDSACGYWESNEQAEEEPENDVQVALFKIAKRVEELAIILKKE